MKKIYVAQETENSIDKVTETYHGKELLTYGWKLVIYVAREMMTYVVVLMKICDAAVAQEMVIYVARLMEIYGALAMEIYDV